MATPNYYIPPWMTGGGMGRIYAEGLDRALQQRRISQQQQFQNQMVTREMGIEEQRWQQQQQQFQQQAEVMAKKATAQQDLQKGIGDLGTRFQPGSPEYANGIASLYLKYGVEAGVPGATEAAAMRAMTPKAVPNMTPTPVMLPGAQPSSGYRDRLNQILQGAGKPGMPPSAPVGQPMGWNIGGKFEKNPAGPLGIRPPSQIQEERLALRKKEGEERTKLQQERLDQNLSVTLNSLKKQRALLAKMMKTEAYGDLRKDAATELKSQADALDKQISELQKAGGAGEVLQLPEREEDLEEGKTYQTAHGKAKWNGKEFELAQ